MIQRLSQDYQFDKAYNYASKLISNSGLQSIEANLYLSIWLNSSKISVMQNNSIAELQKLVDNYRTRSLLTMDDYHFYQALIALWKQDYESAMILLKQITAPRYLDFYNSIEKIRQEIAQQQDLPDYYETALISLQLLKK